MIISLISVIYIVILIVIMVYCFIFYHKCNCIENVFVFTMYIHVLYRASLKIIFLVTCNRENNNVNIKGAKVHLFSLWYGELISYISDGGIL